METIKEEKKADLEQLLNSLIEKGFRPFGRTNKVLHIGRTPDNYIYFDGGFGAEMCYSLRDLTSKESGLWQFVCENGMYRKEYLGIYFNDERAKNVFYKIDQWDEEGDVIQTGDMEGDEFIHMSEPEYRIIESALRDESGLENFLLSNIKVDE